MGRLGIGWLRAAQDEARVRFQPFVFLAFAVLCFWVNYPGRLNEDSLQQLIGAANREFLTDHHSPVVMWLWSLPTSLLGQPAGALFVQSLLLAFYAAVIPAQMPRSRRAILALTIEIPFKLSLVVSAGFIIKDILLVGLLLSMLAALQLAQSGRRRGVWLGISAALLIMITMVRPTNFVMLIVACAFWLPLVVRSVRAFAIAFAIVAVTLSVSLPLYDTLNRSVLRSYPTHIELHLFAFDVAGISAATGRNLFADVPGLPADLPPYTDCYKPHGASSFGPWGPCRGYVPALLRIGNSGGHDALRQWWQRAVTSHPLDYAKHRAAFTRHLLDSRQVDEPAFARFIAAGLRHLYATNTRERAEDMRRITRDKVAPETFATWEGNSVLTGFATLRALLFDHRFTDLIALLVCVAAVAWHWQRRWRGLPFDAIAALAACIGIGNVVMYAVFGVASQGRFLLPTLCGAVFVAIAMLRSQRVAG